MKCWTAKHKVSAYLDNAVSEEERRELRLHLSSCRNCARESEEYQRVREALRSLPKRTPPADLTVRLKVDASRVRAQSANTSSAWARWSVSLKLALHNLMRPLALPLAGGLCSAVFLFSALVHTFTPAFAENNTPGDVPTVLATLPAVKYAAPVAFGEDDALVDLRIDDQGRIVDYSIVSAPGQQSEQLRRSIENQLLFTEFWPATAFGKPIVGTIRISFRKAARIEVRG